MLFAAVCALLFSSLFVTASETEQKNPKLDYKPGEVLVILSADVNQNKSLDAAETLTGVEKALNGTIAKRVQASRTREIAVVKLQKGLTVERALAEDWPKRDARILHVEPNYRLSKNAIANDPRFSELWGMHNTAQTGGTFDADIDAPEAWDITTGASTVVIAVIDSGVDYTHPDLQVNIWTNPAEVPGDGIDNDGNGYIDDVHGYDFFQNDSDPTDADGHGTHCAGTIAAVGNNGLGVAGVSWNSKIMICRFLDAEGSGWTDDAVEAVYYAVDNGASILSNSWGGGWFSESLKTAIEYARDHNVLFVAAAGNSASDNDVAPHYPSSYDVSNVVAVANTDSSDQLSPSSCYGRNSVDLGAPGSSILSTVPAFQTIFYENFESASVPGFSGTQMTPGGTASWVTVHSDIDTPNKAARVDASNYPYASEIDAWIATPAIDTRNLRGLHISFNYRYEIAPDDRLTLEVWDGSTWQELFYRNNTDNYQDYYFSISIDVPEHTRNAAMRFRFRWVTNSYDNDYFGAEIDSIRLRCIGTDYSSAYAHYSGTSMAAPHVSGTAALVRSLYPSISAADLKARLLMGDSIAALAGKTLSGRRLNAFSSLTTSGLMVTSPNGGESWVRDGIYNIEWLSVGAASQVDIYWTRAEGGSGLIVEAVDNTGSYSWQIPSDLLPGDDYAIYIDDGAGMSDESDMPFEIRESWPWFVESFDDSAFDLSNRSVLFTPSGDSYSVCIETVDALPTSPDGGAVVPLGDDSYASVSLPWTVTFFGQSYSIFYVSSNGFVTFEQGDSTWNETIEKHLSLKRIAGLFCDLDPTAGGTVNWINAGDRIAVTWQDVPQYGLAGLNTFQIELFADGRIRITWLAMDPVDGIVGLSEGKGFASDFYEIDFSELYSCGVEPPSDWTTVWMQDFESGLGGWTIDNTFGSGNGLWHLSTACSASLSGHSRPTAMYYGLDASCTYNNGMANRGVVLSPVYDLSQYPSVPVRMQLHYLLQSEGVPEAYDRATIEISQDNGPFVLLASNDASAAANELVETAGNWQQAVIDLTDFSGSAIRPRFGFDTVDGMSNGFAGFYLDDIAIQAAACPYLIAGDLNADCLVNLVDFAAMAENWLLNCYADPGNPACVMRE
jgi:subtilisin family serine protease